MGIGAACDGRRVCVCRGPEFAPPVSLNASLRLPLLLSAWLQLVYRGALTWRPPAAAWKAGGMREQRVRRRGAAALANWALCMRCGVLCAAEGVVCAAGHACMGAERARNPDRGMQV